jgi:1-deoxy-D-xylulose-5-phosphate synthase
MQYPILETIENPKDLKTLSKKQLELLAKELRQRIIEVMSVNGGHLASSLGSVEFTIALHRCFDSPNDKFLWDVGHQTYPHKLLTGRHSAFDSVRKTHGLCGFTHPEESPHDHFHAGHAGTALSLGLGVAQQHLSKAEAVHHHLERQPDVDFQECRPDHSHP